MVGHGAPPVVAVMVTSDPGDWFEETLESLSDVDYENFSLLVIDNASEEDPTGRIASVYPSAFVKRVDSDSGFSAAANEMIRSVEGAAFYLILHDDVLLDPDSVTEMVSEAFRSNAGIVGPKLVDWDSPEVLRSVGVRVDPFGFSTPISDPGELDQSQHDIARSAFAVSDACMLVRADLFATLEGFDEAIPYFGEDVDLCWRANAAGASVAFCPSARVGHRERFEERREIDNRQRLEIRYEARTMLKNYSLRRLLWVMPVAFVFSIVDLFGSALLGRFQRSGDIAAAWFWNLTHLPSLLKARSRAKKTRRVPDREYVILMRQGSSRLRSLIRGAEGENRLQALAQSGRGYLRDATSRSRRGGIALLVLAVMLIIYGARNLAFGPLPAMREIPVLGRSGGHLLAEWFSGWRETGLGEPGVAPGIVPLGGMLSWVLLGSVSAARRLLVLGPLVIGAIGAWKLLSRSDSTAARAAVLASYSLNPVVLNCVAEGRGQALAIYAIAPWLLRRISRSAGVAPFAEPSDRRPDFWRSAAGASLMLVVAAAVSPLGAAMLLVIVLVCGVVAYAMIDRSGGALMLGLGVVSGLAATAVSSPWLYTAVRTGDAATLTGLFPTAVASPSSARIITGSVGAVTAGPLGWGLVVAAIFCLVAGKKWRFAWSISAWIIALAAWTGAILLARSGDFGGAGLELLLVPAIFAVALAIGIGVLSFEEDVLGSDFGSVQVLAGVAAAGLLVALAPIGVASLDGRWYQPTGDFDSVLDFDTGHDFRTVWIGDPDVLPVSGWTLEHSNLAVGTSVGLSPTLTHRYRADGGVGGKVLVEAVQAAVDGETKRLGRLLGPMGVKYVVVVDRPNPLPHSRQQVPMPENVVTALKSQIDLNSIDVNPAMAMFRVDESWPLRGDITTSAETEQGLSALRDQIRFDSEVPPAVLGRNTGTRFNGRLKTDSVISQSVTADPGWTLTVAGETAKRSDLRGWAQAFRTSGAGNAELKWNTPWSFRGLQAVQVISLLLLLGVATAKGRRHMRVGRADSKKGRSKKVLSVGPVGLIESENAGEPVAGPIDRAPAPPERPVKSGLTDFSDEPTTGGGPESSHETETGDE